MENLHRRARPIAGTGQRIPPAHPGDLLADLRRRPRPRDGRRNRSTGVVTESAPGPASEPRAGHVLPSPGGAWREIVNVDACNAVPVPIRCPMSALQMLCTPITLALMLRRPPAHSRRGRRRGAQQPGSFLCWSAVHSPVAEHHQNRHDQHRAPASIRTTVTHRFPATVPVVVPPRPDWSNRCTRPPAQAHPAGA